MSVGGCTRAVASARMLLSIPVVIRSADCSAAALIYAKSFPTLCPVRAETDCLTLFVTAARDTVDMREIAVYGE